MNKQFKWTEDWRLMLHQKALAAGKKLPKVPRIIPMKRIDINNKNNDKSK